MGAVISLLHKRIVGSHFVFKCLKHLLGAHTFTPSQANLSLCLHLPTRLSEHSNWQATDLVEGSLLLLTALRPGASWMPLLACFRCANCTVNFLSSSLACWFRR